jgi:hypothetical protein
MKRASEVFKKIRFAKMDPKHEKGPTTSTDDEGHYTVGEKEFQQQVDHIKKRAMQEGENKQMDKDPCWSGYQMVGMKKKNGKEVPNCVPANEEVELDEGVYSQQDIEDRENAANPGMRSPRKKKEPPFEGPYKSTKSVVPGKHGAGYSTAKKLARDAMRKQAAKIKPVKEEISNKAKIVKDIVKKKKEESDDKFQAEPILNSRIQKSDNL